jgi:DNA (cytosine-5)-methyltransferase 1
MTRLKVVDFFAGAGGFSEGFRQLGFDVIYATDNWNPAVETFKLNNPDTEVVKADATLLSADDVPRADVIIGGPPCTEFSGSKLGGGGDVEKGMILVTRFLYFVHKLQPRWWIMENVPRLLQTLPRRIPLRRLGVKEDGYLEFPRRTVLNAADYGAPQKRLRLFSGRYPDPVQTNAEDPVSSLDGKTYEPWVSMRRILQAFPDPLKPPSDSASVRDPLFDVTLPEKSLQDHFGDYCVMSAKEAERNRRQKMEHPYYGKMKFPDDLDRPARTVMATQFNASRETMVIETQHDGKKAYRKPTIRECASLQCYPVNYAFAGNTATTKYKLVGNSVPSRLSTAVARAILVEAGAKVPVQPLIRV